MSLKSFIQILLLLLIISILVGVYYKYFSINKNVVQEVNTLEIDNQEQLNKLEKKISELEKKNNELIKKIENAKEKPSGIDPKNKSDKQITKINEEKKNKLEIDNKIQKIDTKKNDINDKFKEDKNVEIKKSKDLVKDVEYNSVDDKGNKFYLLANSGKSNTKNKDVLDLDNVRGEITSDKRDTIYIVSDFAEFNSVNSNSKFYDNVVINYQDIQITCENFDINMETNKAIAYNNVKVTNLNSEMKAGMVEFDLKTKNIDINPETATADIKVITN